MEKEPPFGFVLVTSDPMTQGEKRGAAFALVQARLSRKAWPLYERTRHRSSMGRGARLAFYVAGCREWAGHLVATGKVAGIRGFRYGQPSIDPEQFITDFPASVLELEDVEITQSPINLRERIGELTICPKNRKNWGSVLQGGVAALGRDDWDRLFEGRGGRT